MKYSDLVLTAVTTAFGVALLASPSAARSGGGNTKVKPPKVSSASAKPNTVKVKAPKAQAAKPAKAPKAKAAGSTTPTTSSATASTKPSKADKGNKKGTEATPQVSSGSPSDTDPTLNAPLSKAQEKLLKNDNLRAKLQSRLPRGMDVMTAAAGFRNLGQFVATVNVSNNKGIEFNLLKRLIVGRGLSLGQAIQQAKAMDAASANTIANAAVAQANADIAASAN